MSDVMVTSSRPRVKPPGTMLTGEKPSFVVEVLDEPQIEAAIDYVVASYDGNDRTVLRRAVVLTHTAIFGLLAEPFMGRWFDPMGFRLPAPAIARRVRDLAGGRRSGAWVDPFEIEILISALVGAKAFVLVTVGNSRDRLPSKRAHVLALRSSLDPQTIFTDEIVHNGVRQTAWSRYNIAIATGLRDLTEETL